MRTVISVAAASALAVVAMSCSAKHEERDDGLKVGDGLGTFQVVKAGGIDDGVQAGKSLCYM